MTPPSSSRVRTSPRALRCVHCHSTRSYGINTPVKHNQCQWPWLCTSTAAGPRELWHCTFVSLEQSTGTGIHTRPSQSSSQALQHNTKDTAAICRQKKHSHLLPLAFSLGQVPWRAPQNCHKTVLHTVSKFRGKGEYPLAAKWLLKTKDTAHLNVEKRQDAPKVTELRTSLEQPI